jgi:hypothetical protein
VKRNVDVEGRRDQLGQEEQLMPIKRRLSFTYKLATPDVKNVHLTRML